MTRCFEFLKRIATAVLSRDRSFCGRTPAAGKTCGIWTERSRNNKEDHRMLKGIPSILTPDLLKILMEMGHSDEIVIADGNFPAASIAKRLVRLDGHAIP